MKAARIIFLLAGLYGIGVLVPDYFTESWFGVRFPPPISHAEFFFGFVGVALVFQILFLMVARNPLKHRALMPVCILEKLSYIIPCVVLYAQGRLQPLMLVSAGIDAIWAILFFVAYKKTPQEETYRNAPSITD